MSAVQIMESHPYVLTLHKSPAINFSCDSPLHTCGSWLPCRTKQKAFALCQWQPQPGLSPARPIPSQAYPHPGLSPVRPIDSQAYPQPGLSPRRPISSQAYPHAGLSPARPIPTQAEPQPGLSPARLNHSQARSILFDLCVWHSTKFATLFALFQLGFGLNTIWLYIPFGNLYIDYKASLGGQVNKRLL